MIRRIMEMTRPAFRVILALMLSIVLLAGCGAPSGENDTQNGQTQNTITQENGTENDQNAGNPTNQNAGDPAAQNSVKPIDRNGSYTTKEDVALYLFTYGTLPNNFITKKQAKKLGWQGGSLEQYAPGKCIGGDYYGNYEGRLPEDEEYHECDIDTLGAKSRGPKRLVYSDDHIYYTGDHYESFELLYGEEE